MEKETTVDRWRRRVTYVLRGTEPGMIDGSWRIRISVLIALIICGTSIALMCFGVRHYMASHMPEAMTYALSGFLLFVMRLLIKQALMSIVRDGGGVRIVKPLEYLFGIRGNYDFRGRGNALAIGLALALGTVIGAGLIYRIFPIFWTSINPLWWIPIGAAVGSVVLVLAIIVVFSLRELPRKIKSVCYRGIGPWRTIKEFEDTCFRQRQEIERLSFALGQLGEKELRQLLKLENDLFEARNKGLDATRAIREELTTALLARLTADHPAYMYLKARAPKTQNPDGAKTVAV